MDALTQLSVFGSSTTENNINENKTKQHSTTTNKKRRKTLYQNSWSFEICLIWRATTMKNIHR